MFVDQENQRITFKVYVDGPGALALVETVARLEEKRPVPLMQRLFGRGGQPIRIGSAGTDASRRTMAPSENWHVETHVYGCALHVPPGQRLLAFKGCAGVIVVLDAASIAACADVLDKVSATAREFGYEDLAYVGLANKSEPVGTWTRDWLPASAIHIGTPAEAQRVDELLQAITTDMLARNKHFLQR